MKKTIFTLVSLALLTGCASNPNKISASYVSPLKYRSYNCNQIAMEMDTVSHKISDLHTQLKKESDKDNIQMGVGLLVFWPALFFLEGGDGAEATQYANLKGEYEALEDVIIQKECSVAYKSPDELMQENLKEEDMRLAEEAEDFN